MQDNTEFLITLIELKEASYKNTLALLGIIELLIDKKIISQSELSIKTAELNRCANFSSTDATSAPAPSNRSNTNRSLKQF